MQTLRIFLLRQPTVLWGETHLKIPRRALRHLLFYLACQPEVNRDTLCTLFWDEGSDKDVRARLRTSLSKLRAALPDPDLLVAGSEHIQLDRSRVWVDVQEFRNLVKFNLRPARQISIHDPLPEALAHNLRRAADLWEADQVWSGADFLDTSEFEDWLENLRQTLAFDYLQVLERLAFNAAAHGDLDLALARTRRLLDLDPLNDKLHAQTLTWLIRLGRSTQAQEYIDKLRSTYAKNATPLPGELQSLIDSLNHNSAPPSTDPLSEPWSHTLVTGIPFLNREELVNEFKRSLARGGLFLIEGEAGVGKTRFLYEIFHSLEPAPRLLLLNGRSSEQALPFQALINALRHQVTPAEWLALDDIWAARLTGLLPELLQLHPELQPQPVEPGNPVLLLEALRQLLLVLSRFRKMLLILDDAQWCDSATFEALAFISKSGFFFQRGTLILSCRLEDQTPAVSQFLLLESTGTPAYRLRLERFKPEEVERVTQYILGQPIPSALVDRLVSDTGGNPFFLLEALYWILNNAPVDLNHLTYQLPVSGYVHALTHERLHRMSPNAHRLIEAAAVLGEEFTPDLLEAASGLPSEQVAQAIEELENTFLIQSIQDQPPNYRFVYAKAREVILPGVSRARQRLMHLRAARALEAANRTHPQAVSARLAEHYEKAGDAQRALQHWITAGNHALHQFMPDQAHIAFARAEQLLMSAPSFTPDAMIYQLYNEWNDAASASGNAELMREINTRFLELAENRLNALLIGSALNGLARASLHANDIPLSLQLCDRVTFYLNQAGDLYESVRLCNTRGDCLARTDQFQAAIKAFNQSLLYCEQTNNPRLLDKKAHAQYSLSEIYHASGYPIQVAELAQGCLKTSLQARNPEWTMKAHFMLVMADYYQGHLPDAQDHARQGAKIAASLKNSHYCAYFDVVLARVELAQGWLSKSWQHYLEAQTLGEQDHPPRVLSLAASQRGQTYRFLRQFNLATQAYRAGIELSLFTHARLECQFRLGLSLAGEGKIEESLATLRQCLSQARAVQFEFIALLAEASLLIILAQTGQVESVKQALPALVERANGRNIVEVDTSLDYIQAQLALHAGQTEEARAYLHRVVDRGASAGILWWELQGWIELAKTGIAPSQYQARVQKLLDTLSQHSHHLPDLSEPVRLFKQWVKRQLEYT